MAEYVAPIDDMVFVLTHLAGLGDLARLPGYGDATPDLVRAILEEAGRLAGERLAPLNAPGDRQGSRLGDDGVRMPDGFREAYAAYRDGGWNGLPFDPAHGGMGLPWAVGFAVQEMWQSANMSFGICPLLNAGCVELLQTHGTPAQKALWLPRLIAGQWTGTMNLTEPQAGSDLSAVRCRAEPAADGTYRLFGQKTYISYGDHDLAENIVHLVLARLPGAAAGANGLSLFLVPKVLVNGDGTLGARNDVRCVSLERKLGLHASPTCIMAFGDETGAVGHLVGQEHEGLRAMFTMMNSARLLVGLQGIALAERAFQRARGFARDRVQGVAVGQPAGSRHPIIRHPDVRRMVLEMAASTQAARALAYHTAAQFDLARAGETEDERARARARLDLLTPVVKAWSTDIGAAVASTAIQVHGGMGYIEETGAAQHLRDARVAPIYEGTNGIQASDLAFRKVARDNGTAALALVAEMRSTLQTMAQAGDAMAPVRRRLAAAVDSLEAATRWVAAEAASRPAAVAAVATPFLRLFGIVSGGHLMARAGLAASAASLAGRGDPSFLRGKLAALRFFADHELPAVAGLAATVTGGADAVLDPHEDWL